MNVLWISFAIAVLIGVQGTMAPVMAGAMLFGLTLVLALLQSGGLTGANLVQAGLALLGFNAGLCLLLGARILLVRPALSA